MASRESLRVRVSTQPCSSAAEHGVIDRRTVVRRRSTVVTSADPEWLDQTGSNRMNRVMAVISPSSVP
jgi:hypothetical protein